MMGIPRAFDCVCRCHVAPTNGRAPWRRLMCHASPTARCWGSSRTRTVMAIWTSRAAALRSIPYGRLHRSGGWQARKQASLSGFLVCFPALETRPADGERSGCLMNRIEVEVARELGWLAAVAEHPYQSVTSRFVQWPARAGRGTVPGCSARPSRQRKRVRSTAMYCTCPACTARACIRTWKLQ